MTSPPTFNLIDEPWLRVRTLTGAVEEHDGDLGVVFPGIQRLREKTDHRGVERIDGARPIQGQVADTITRTGEDGGFDVASHGGVRA